MTQGRNENRLECPPIEAENAANSGLLARFATKSGGITGIFIRSSSYAEVSIRNKKLIDSRTADSTRPAQLRY
ncbi:MAG: hypothetical protein ACJAYF_002024 [Arenicella sp.]|jgi:hypothetical protein